MNEILNSHPYKITESINKSNGKIYKRFSTRIKDEQGKSKVVSRNTKEALYKFLIDYYKHKIPINIKFEDVFNEWLEFKSDVINDGTIRRYRNDYIRFFKEKAIAQKNIAQITSKDISEFVGNTVKKHHLKVKAYQALRSYMDNIFRYAYSEEYISKNPYARIEYELRQLTKKCDRTITSSCDRTVSLPERKAILAQLNKDYRNKPEYIVAYSIEFAMLTGCRTGEIAAVKWSDIKDDWLYIRHSEKAHRVEGQKITYTIEGTKTNKERKFPISKWLKDLLKRIEIAENNINCKGEFIFSDVNGRITGQRIAACIKTKNRHVYVSSIVTNGTYRKSK